MVNTDRIKGLMREQRKKQQYMADVVGIALPTLNAKLNGVYKFNAEEMMLIADDLGCTIDSLFLRKTSQN